MKIGMLWFDDDPHSTLKQKIAQAATRYTQKYGIIPNTCYIHPNQKNGVNKVGPVKVKTLPTMLLHHLWIGQEENPK